MVFKSYIYKDDSLTDRYNLNLQPKEQTILKLAISYLNLHV